MKCNEMSSKNPNDLRYSNKELTNNCKRVIIIGIDGGDYELIRKWINEGKLSNLKKIAEKGVFTRLKTTIPPLTGPAWASFLTGMYPGKTNVYDMFYLYWRNGIPTGIKPLTWSNFFKQTFVYLLSIAGKKVVLVNVPLTYPPKRINGIVISGFGTPSEESEYTYPRELKRYLEEKYGYRIEPDPKISPLNKDVYLKHVLDVLKSKNRAVLDLMSRKTWDVFIYVIRETDHVSHFFWKYIDPSHPQHDPSEAKKYGDAIFKVYKEVDEFIGKVMKMMDENTLLFIISDHGFTKEAKRVNFNLFLIMRKYITLKNKWKLRIYNILTQIGLILYTHIIKHFPRLDAIFQMMLSNRKVSTHLMISVDDVDWSNTKCFSLGSKGSFTPIYIVSKNKDAVKKELTRDLHELANGEIKIVKKIYDTDEIYRKGIDYHGPDLWVEFVEGYVNYVVAYPSLAEGHKIITKSPRRSGTHDLDAILLIYDKRGTFKGTKIEDAKIVDLAPTILSIFNLPIPDYMDGKMLLGFGEKLSVDYKKYRVRVELLEKIEGLRRKLKTKSRV